jgi:hypothetical protein
LKLKANNKTYPITSSPLYDVKSLHNLANVLLVTVSKLTSLEKSILDNQDKHYHVFEQGEEKKREIQHPYRKDIMSIHGRMKYLLSRCELPAFVKSGKKGSSYIDNATAHTENEYMITMDICKFYANTRDEVIYQFFIYKMKMAHDIAHILTNICTFKSSGSIIRKIPTGSKVSQILAYWAYSDMFDEIADLCVQQNISFTLYVDDMTFSSSIPFSKDFHKSIQEILASRWLTFKTTKLQKYGVTDKKHVTGCVITSKKSLVAPNKLKKKTINSIHDVLTSDEGNSKDIQRALGLIQSCQQIQPSLFIESQKNIKRIRINTLKKHPV